MATKLTLTRLESLLFINTDREYKEGKNQNSLRPEDIEKITHVYHDHLANPLGQDPDQIDQNEVVERGRISDDNHFGRSRSRVA